MFKITPIGSCRITTPLKRGQKTFGFDLNMARCYGYCHTPAEAVQMARYMQGPIDIPEDVWPLISRAYLPNEIAAALHEKSNLYVVEIASSKEVTIDGISVQLNYLNGQFREFFSDKGRAEQFWKIAETGTHDEKSRFLEVHWSGSTRHLDQGRLLARISMRRVTPESLLRDLQTLKELLQNVLVVSHIDARKPNGGKIASRSIFITQVETAAQAAQLAFYNPTNLMDVFGQTNAIEDESTALAHFTDQFGAAIMQEWMSSFIAPLTDQIAANDIKSVQKLLVPQISAAFENMQYAVAQRRFDQVQHLSPKMARLTAKLAKIQTASQAEFMRSATAALDTAMTEDTVLMLINQAQGHALFDWALKLALQYPAGVQALPKYTVFQLAIGATRAAQFDAAIGFWVPLLSHVDSINAPLFANACIACGKNLAERLSQKKTQDIIANLDMALRIEFVDLIGGDFRDVVLPSTTANDVLTAIRYHETAIGFSAAIELLSLWRRQQNRETVIDIGLVALLDEWVSVAVKQTSFNDRIDALKAVLSAAPRHPTARLGMQAVRKDLTVEIRNLGASGDIATLLELSATVAKLQTSLPELDLWIARLQFKHGDFEAAIDAGERAAENLPAKINNWVLLMRAANQLGKDDKAVAYAKNVIELASTSNANLCAEGQAILDSKVGRA